MAENSKKESFISLSLRTDKGHTQKFKVYLMKLQYVNQPLQIVICALDYYRILDTFFFYQHPLAGPFQ